MARPEQPIIRTREGERGTASAVESLIQEVPLPEEDDGFDEEGFEDEDIGAEFDMGDPLNGDLEDVLFVPSERPDEPLTAGVEFGPGPLTVPFPNETERDFRLRVADALVTSPSATASVKAFADRLLRGE